LHLDTPPPYDGEEASSRDTQAGVTAEITGEAPSAAQASALRSTLGQSGTPWSAAGLTDSEAPQGASAIHRTEGVVVADASVVDSTVALDQFYRDVLFELGEFVQRRGATATGAAVVVKRVAVAHGIEVASRLPLPRLSRAEREERSDETWRGNQ